MKVLSIVQYSERTGHLAYRLVVYQLLPLQIRNMIATSVFKKWRGVSFAQIQAKRSFRTRSEMKYNWLFAIVLGIFSGAVFLSPTLSLNLIMCSRLYDFQGAA